MRSSPRSSTAIVGLLAAGIAVPAIAQAASSGSAAAPPPSTCAVAAPSLGSIVFKATPEVIKQGTRPRVAYSITNTGTSCVGVSAAPYALQISGFAGWSNVPWNLGLQPQFVRLLQPGQTTRGVTAPLPANLSAGAYYRLVPRFTPDATPPAASAPITVAP